MMTDTWRSQILRTLNIRLGHYRERVVCTCISAIYARVCTVENITLGIHYKWTS